MPQTEDNLPVEGVKDTKDNMENTDKLEDTITETETVDTDTDVNIGGEGDDPKNDDTTEKVCIPFLQPIKNIKAA
jgi:hypothetical protein